MIKRNTATQAPPQTHGFTIRSKIARAVGKDSRYASQHVLATPAAKSKGVILQATDGHQAVCLHRPGYLDRSTLVPVDVLPTRLHPKDVSVEITRHGWQSSEGRIAPEPDESESRFPPIIDVLPVVDEKPLALGEEQAKAVGDRRVVLALDVELLRKIAESFGTPKLSLMIPVPQERQSPGQDAYVSQAVAICPATNSDDIEGIAVLMPVNPERSTAYYKKLREIVGKKK